MRRDAEERRRQEERERAERNRAAQKRREAIVDRIRQKQEAEERRLQEAAATKLREIESQKRLEEVISTDYHLQYYLGADYISRTKYFYCKNVYIWLTTCLAVCLLITGSG